MGKHPLPTQTGATPGTEQKSITGLQRWHSRFSCFSQNWVWSSGPALSASVSSSGMHFQAMPLPSLPLPFPSLSLAEQARQPSTAQVCSSANSPGGHLHSLKAGEP